VNARDEVLARVRRALGDRPSAEAPSIPRRYRPAGSSSGADLGELFADRVGEYRASVHRTPRADLADRLRAVLIAEGVRRVVFAPGFPTEWALAWQGSPGAEPVADDPLLSVAELDRLDAVVTTCAVAIADTGTVVLDHGPGQGRRALTLVPDRHVVVVETGQLVAGVPDAIATLDPARPLTWISGPSATSDIELNRVEGVHGPRRLHVVLVDG
jgi:L-lactate dehydrogenase complex protein LldG